MSTLGMNQILVGEAREKLAALPAGLFHTVVTSPPYWNLRSYLPKDHPDKGREIGSEATPEAFVATMVDVFRAVRRVLRDDGTLWVNLGDSYGDDSKWGGATGGKHVEELHGEPIGRRRVAAGVTGQLLMPHRVAMALQADGWILRSTIIWAKKSPMPESISGWRWVRCRVKVEGGWTKETHPATAGRSGVFACDGTSPERPASAKFTPCPGCPKCKPTGGYVLRRGKWRPTTAHEYLFLFSKSERYFADGDAVQEAVSGGTHDPGANRRSKLEEHGSGCRNNGDFNRSKPDLVETRNPRSVWLLGNEPYKGAHFATFPTKLIKPCIEAGTSKAGCCPACGSPWAPVVESERVATRPGTDSKVIGAMNPESPYMDHTAIGNRDPQRHVAVSRVTGHRPTCSCPTDEVAGYVGSVPCRVLDPFGGSGTTAQVAQALGREWIICELNPEYVPLAMARINTLPRWAQPKVNGKRVKPMAAQQELFA